MEWAAHVAIHDMLKMLLALTHGIAIFEHGNTATRHAPTRAALIRARVTAPSLT